MAGRGRAASRKRELEERRRREASGEADESRRIAARNRRVAIEIIAGAIPVARAVRAVAGLGLKALRAVKAAGSVQKAATVAVKSASKGPKLGFKERAAQLGQKAVDNAPVAGKAGVKKAVKEGAKDLVGGGAAAASVTERQIKKSQGK